MTDRDLAIRAHELMNGAAQSFTSVQGTLHLSRHPEAARAAWERRKSFAKFPTYAVELTDEQRARLPRRRPEIPNEADGRLWVRHPWTVRVEGQIGWEQQPWCPVLYRIVQIHYKHDTWTWDLNRSEFKGKEGSGGRPNGPAELFDPRRVLRYWALTPLGHGEVAGRRTIRVRAEPDPPDPDRYSIDMLNHLSWVGNAADAWELDVDSERGILLRLAGIVTGEVYFVVAFTSVTYDEPIADAVFTFADLTDEDPPLWHQRLDDVHWGDPFLP